MPTASWRPDFFIGCAFNANPNDPNATRVWSELTSLFRKASSHRRGRQYELDQNQGAQPSMVFLDPNEYLNPANTASPYSPNVLPYREILWQGMWPNGGVGNLLNTGAQGTSYDPSFESYTVGTAVTWLTAVGGTTPLVATTTPHTGAHDVSWTVVNGATVQGVSWTLPTMPGRQYTTSAYVRQSSASTQQIAITGVAAGTSTSSTGAWVRLTVTWTATQPSHTVTVQTTGTAVAGTVLLDDVQHEPGAAASTFTTTGPVIYGILRDYVERWPSRWDYQGFLGYAETTLVDAFAPQNKLLLNTELRNSTLAKKPTYYWTLGEPSGSTAFADTSGNYGPSLAAVPSVYGGGTTGITPGTAANIPGDPSGTGVKITPDYSTPGSPFVQQAAVVGTNYFGVQPNNPIQYPASLTQPWAGTFAAWVNVTAPANATYNNMYILDAVGVCQLYLTAGSSVTAAGWAATATAATSITDGKPHMVLATQSVAAGNETITLYVDGTQVATNTAAISVAVPYATGILLGGLGNLDNCNGVVTQAAMWASRALSTAEISDLWSAGGHGYTGETSGARIGRYIGYGWNGLTAIDTGQSTMGISNLSAGTSLLSAIQDVTTTENGNYWVDPRGYSTFYARTRRYLETSSVYTFGENVAGGEFPYLEDLAYDLDPTLIYNDVEVTNSSGVIVKAINTASQTAYFVNSYQRTINVANNSEAVDCATYLMNQHDIPRQRVSVLTLDPVGNPNLWPVVLSLEVGMRVTVKRRPKAANVGAGITMSADFFVESISHDNIDMDNGTWQTQLLLSPVDIAQVGILDSSTFGRLGISSATLASGITASATSASVTCPGGDLFTTTGVPFSATIDSEIVTVTAVTGVASPQTFTITRPTDGTATAHSSGAAVQVYQPFILAY